MGMPSLMVHISWSSALYDQQLNQRSETRKWLSTPTWHRFDFSYTINCTLYVSWSLGQTFSCTHWLFDLDGPPLLDKLQPQTPQLESFWLFTIFQTMFSVSYVRFLGGSIALVQLNWHSHTSFPRHLCLCLWAQKVRAFEFSLIITYL